MIREIYITLLIILSLIPSLTDAYRYSGSYSHGSYYSSGSTHWLDHTPLKTVFIAVAI